jgi:CRP-like cAMP-binding protein
VSGSADGAFLARLTPEDREFLVGAGRPGTSNAGETLFRQGDPSTHVVFLLSGWVKVSLSSSNGHEALLAIRGAGDVLGDLAALDAKPRSATVRTLTPLRVSTLSADRFVRCLHERPQIAIALLAHNGDRLRRSDTRRMEQGAYRSPERLAVHLLRLASQYGTATDEGVVIEMRLSQQELADAIGASREAVARALHVLRERGVLLTRRRRIVIAVPEVLHSMAATMPFDADEP